LGIEEKLKLLMETNEIMRKVAGITNAVSSFDAFASTSGSPIRRAAILNRPYRVRAGMEALAVREGEMQRRCYPNSFRGQFHTGGFEYVRKYDLMSNASALPRKRCSCWTPTPAPA